MLRCAPWPSQPASAAFQESSPPLANLWAVLHAFTRSPIRHEILASDKQSNCDEST
jgi:hypothetical protein